jgi:hypothetical protein
MYFFGPRIEAVLLWPDPTFADALRRQSLPTHPVSWSLITGDSLARVHQALW